MKTSNLFIKSSTKSLEDEVRSWDNEYQTCLPFFAVRQAGTYSPADNIRHAQIRRTAPKGKNGVLVLAQKGGEFTFSFGLNAQESHAMSPEDALKLFEALQEESRSRFKAFEPVYKNIKQIFARKPQVPLIKANARPLIRCVLKGQSARPEGLSGRPTDSYEAG